VKVLIVNADDLGLTDGVNGGVLRAHCHGIVTSASMMVRQPAAEAAAAAARLHPRLSLGLHVDLGEWRLADGEWTATYLRADPINHADVQREVESQLAAFRRLVGRDPTHIDSHQHVHREEPACGVLGDLASHLGIPLRHRSAARYFGGFYGRGRDNRPLPEAITPEALVMVLRALPDGVTELCCHPGESTAEPLDYDAERRIELTALCHPTVRAELRQVGVELRAFGQT
jgi:predicted glycoside hydrolase/deacetylase ChbG (UPF0249 family)